MAKRQGRGWLSAIEKLPEEAAEIVRWAANELADRKRLQAEIYTEFREKLIALQGEQGLAFDIPSASSFNRYSTQQAVITKSLETATVIASNIAPRLDGLGNEDLTTLVLQMLKTQIYDATAEMMQLGRTHNPKGILEMARALASIVATAKLSEQQRALFQAEVDAATESAIDQAAEVAKEAGVSAERIKQMRHDFLGLRPNLTARPPDTGAPT